MRLDRIASNPAVVTPNISPQQTGQTGEARPVTEKTHAAEPDPHLLERSVERANEMLKNMDNNMVEFQMDEKNRLVIKVIDRGTHEVVDQFPSERLLKVMESMDELLGALLDHKA